MSEKTKPCPFCGGDIEIVMMNLFPGQTEPYYYPRCGDVDCVAGEDTMDSATIEGAKALWNKRT